MAPLPAGLPLLLLLLLVVPWSGEGCLGLLRGVEVVQAGTCRVQGACIPGHMGWRPRCRCWVATGRQQLVVPLLMVYELKRPSICEVLGVEHIQHTIQRAVVRHLITATAIATAAEEDAEQTRWW